LIYNRRGTSSRACLSHLRANCEESPNTAGQGAGQHPGAERRWKVQQKTYRRPHPLSPLPTGEGIEGEVGKGEMARQELTAQTATSAAVQTPPGARSNKRPHEGCPSEAAGRLQRDAWQHASKIDGCINRIRLMGPSCF
jgi:hypothetical protein